MPLYLWSQTAGSNATADPTINFAEGQAPSSINDSARALMTSVAKYRDDIVGAIVTGGTSTNYTLTSYSVFDTLAHMNGQMIAFSPHTANGATVTLNVDGLGAKPLRVSPNVELQSNVLIQGTPYVATYNNSDGAFYLHNLASNTYGIPLGAGMDFWLPTAPSSAFAFPTGQAISRTTYATLFAAMGTTYGVGDGSTTFNLPDKTGRVSAMKEAVATRLTSGISGVDGATMGSAAGGQSQTLTVAQIPSHQHNVYLKDPGHTHTTNASRAVGGASYGGSNFTDATAIIDSATTGITIGSVNGTANDNQTAASGSGGAHNNVQPTIVCNYIIRII